MLCLKKCNGRAIVGSYTCFFDTWRTKHWRIRNQCITRCTYRNILQLLGLRVLAVQLITSRIPAVFLQSVSATLHSRLSTCRPTIGPPNTMVRSPGLVCIYCLHIFSAETIKIRNCGINWQPDSWPVCFTVGAITHFVGHRPQALAWRR